MKIASWNVNSIKARGEHVKNWLTENKPDVLMVQELKGLDFPATEFEAIGYKTEAVTQKAYNGVAVFVRHDDEVKHDFEVINTALPGDKNDEQARYIEIKIGDLTLIDIYLPNGNPVTADSDKFPYKLGWMDRLITRIKELRAAEEDFLIGGDFNIIPEAKDCYDPKTWEGDALFHPESRAKFRAMLNCGMTEAFRVFDNRDKQYTFWDYQGGCWPQNKGIRIDHFLLSPAIADRMKSCMIDTAPRALDKPSDHTPIVLELADNEKSEKAE